MPPPPTQYHQGERSASPKPARLWRMTRSTVVATSVEKSEVGGERFERPDPLAEPAHHGDLDRAGEPGDERE